MNKQHDIDQLVLDYLRFVEEQPSVSFPLADDLSEQEIRRVSYSIPTPRSMSSPIFDVERELLPQIIQSLAKSVKAKYNDTTLRAVGYNLCRFMTMIEGRTPALVAGNYGQCMAALQGNIDMSGMLGVRNMNWLDGGEETRMDEARTAAQTYTWAPYLFAPLYLEKGGSIISTSLETLKSDGKKDRKPKYTNKHIHDRIMEVGEDAPNLEEEGTIISMSLAALGRIDKKNLRPSYTNKHIHDRLMEVGKDVPVFLSVAMKHLIISEQHAKHICHTLGLFEEWGLTEDSSVDPEVLGAWREVLDPSERLTEIQKNGKKRLDRMALTAISENSAKVPGKPGQGKSLKM